MQGRLHLPKFLLSLIFLITASLASVLYPSEALATASIGRWVDSGSVNTNVDCQAQNVKISFSLTPFGETNRSQVERIRIEMDDNLANPFDPNVGFDSFLAIEDVPARPSGLTIESNGTFTTRLEASKGFVPGQTYIFRIITHINQAGLNINQHGPGYTGTDPHLGQLIFDGGRTFSDSTNTRTFTYCGKPSPTSKPMPGPDLTGGKDPAKLCDLNDYFKSAVQILSVLAGFAFFVMIIVGGYRYLNSAGNPKGTDEARKIITFAVIGLVVLLLAWVILLLVQNISGANLTIFNICPLPS